MKIIEVENCGKCPYINFGFVKVHCAHPIIIKNVAFKNSTISDLGGFLPCCPLKELLHKK